LCEKQPCCLAERQVRGGTQEDCEDIESGRPEGVEERSKRTSEGTENRTTQVSLGACVESNRRVGVYLQYRDDLHDRNRAVVRRYQITLYCI